MLFSLVAYDSSVVSWKEQIFNHGDTAKIQLKSISYAFRRVAVSPW